MNYLHWGLSEFGVTADTRLPLLTSLSFDVTGTSVFLPLISGGTVVLMREQPNHLSLRKLLTTTGSTMLNLTPSHLELIGRLDIAPPGFRSIVVVGEALRLEVAARAQEMFGAECRIINEYGPTEATIGITSHVFDPVLDAERSTVPIGVPAPNTQVHLLDPSGRSCPPARSARCTWPVPSWPGATWAGPTSTPSASPPWSTAPGCTAPVTWPAGCPRAGWSSSAGSTTR